MFKVSTTGRSPILAGEPDITQQCKCCGIDIVLKEWQSDFCPFCEVNK